MALFDFFRRNTADNQTQLEKGLEPTRTGMFGRLARAVAGKHSIDDDVLDELESVLLQSDVGVATTVKIINRIRARAAKGFFTGELEKLLQTEVAALLTEQSANLGKLDIEPPMHEGKRVPYTILVVGVNGVGKTTTIGKLAHQFQQAGYKVLLGAGDTFRAAAVEQLKIWGQRVGAPVVDRGQDVDPAAVAHDALKEGMALGVDVVIIDTAGRLHNKVHLMNELAKVRRTLGKLVPNAPHEVLLVLDASTGQNAFQQAAEFTKATQVTALALTKLDGTAKGGVVIGISDQFQVPVKYIGVGEKMTDLQLFDPERYVNSLFQSGSK